jgi:hypothetical protein
MFNSVFVKVACIAQHGNVYYNPFNVSVKHRKHRHANPLIKAACKANDRPACITKLIKWI